MATRRNKKGSARRWARVPTGNETCGFCFMLASRGFDYLTAKSAGEGDGHSHFYDSCDCAIVQEPADGSEIDGYDYKAMRRHFNRYYEAAGKDVDKACNTLSNDLYATKKLVEAGVVDPVEYSYFGIGERWARCAKTVGVAVRPDSVDDLVAIVEECRFRDADWLKSGKEPRITFETEELRREIEKDRPQEITTAERLKKHGINPDFVVDGYLVLDEATGRYRKVGLADLANKAEIKTLENAATFNTIDGYIKNTSNNKENAQRLYFDNVDNPCLTDEQLISFILESRRFRRGSIYVIKKDGQVKKIR